MALTYTTAVTIHRPIEEVVRLMDDPDNLKHWQPGFQGMEPIEGEPGKAGSKSRLRYKMGKREVEMIETITKRNLPDEFDAVYEANGVWNEQANRFIKVDDNTTKWVSESTFKMDGFMMKLMGWLMPGAFKRQSQSYLDHFKAFAEDGTSLSEKKG